MNRRNIKPVRGGALWGMLIISTYIIAYIWLGVMMLGDAGWPRGFTGFIALAISSIGYLIVGIIGLIFSFFLALNFTLRDPNIKRSVKNNWPLIIGILYFIFPDFLIGNPIDDIIVLIITAVISYKKNMADNKGNDQYTNSGNPPGGKIIEMEVD